MSEGSVQQLYLFSLDSEIIERAVATDGEQVRVVMLSGGDTAELERILRSRMLRTMAETGLSPIDALGSGVR